jgi:hypothetical protein
VAGVPRLLAIMGSGETSPTMAKTHRELLARVGPPPVLLDTPFGFQANADDLVAKATEYFRVSVGADLGLASWRSAAEADALATGRALARLREAHYVFSGPGSPSYALRQWAGSPIPGALADLLATGGCVTFASAAALTLGVATVPVYEIYKVGAAPEWLEGLDLLGALGLRAAVIPHYDNAEGGTHDTRFCYLGEPRLARLERELPEGAFVLGVDEHTALVLDLAAGTASVLGSGVVTLRLGERSRQLPAGSTVTMDELGRESSVSPGRVVGFPRASRRFPAGESSVSRGRVVGFRRGHNPARGRRWCPRRVRGRVDRPRRRRRRGRRPGSGAGWPTGRPTPCSPPTPTTPDGCCAAWCWSWPGPPATGWSSRLSGWPRWWRRCWTVGPPPAPTATMRSPTRSTKGTFGQTY